MYVKLLQKGVQTMNATQILFATTYVSDALVKYQTDTFGTVSATRADKDLTTLPTPRIASAHALWLCNAIPELVHENRLEKAQRWLCFTQGVLWMLGIAPIRSLKEANMPRI